MQTCDFQTWGTSLPSFDLTLTKIAPHPQASMFSQHTCVCPDSTEHHVQKPDPGLHLVNTEVVQTIYDLMLFT